MEGGREVRGESSTQFHAGPARNGDQQVAATRLRLTEGAQDKSDPSLFEAMGRRLVEAVDHQVRTPLTTLLGHVELLADLGPELPPALARSLPALRRAGHRLRDAVVWLTELVDIECAAHGPAVQVRLDTMVTDLARMFEQCANERCITLKVCVAGPVTVSVADPKRLAHGVYELFDNALTYAPDGSTVTAQVICKGSEARICVTDQGPGIDHIDRERLLLPFELGDHPHQRRDCKGLGLARATAFAEAHQGSLTLQDHPSGGLEVCVRLPNASVQTYPARPELPA
jgi:signal transduction histidine kinase